MAGVVGVCCPVFGLGPPLSYCSCPFCIVLLPLVLSSSSSLFVFAVTALLVWGCVFVTGLCHCGIVVMIVRVGRTCDVYCLLSTLQCCGVCFSVVCVVMGSV